MDPRWYRWNNPQLSPFFSFGWRFHRWCVVKTYWFYWSSVFYLLMLPCRVIIILEIIKPLCGFFGEAGRKTKQRIVICVQPEIYSSSSLLKCDVFSTHLFFVIHTKSVPYSVTHPPFLSCFYTHFLTLWPPTVALFFVCFCF